MIWYILATIILMIISFRGGIELQRYGFKKNLEDVLIEAGFDTVEKFGEAIDKVKEKRKIK